MTDVVSHTLKLALPDSMKACAVESFRYMQLPSPATMSRFRLRLDTAFMMLMKQRHKVPDHVPHSIFTQEKSSDLFAALDVVRIWWIDSSPQGGVDWLVMTTLEARTQDLVDILLCRREMASLVEAYGLGNELTMKARARYTDLDSSLRSKLCQHRWPLTALGTGAGSSGLAHKAACWLHAVHLESAGALSLRWVFASSLSACVDLGTESGLGQAIDIDLQKVFPPGCGPQRALVPDGDDIGTIIGKEDAIGLGSVFSHLMPFGLVVPGNLHILDSISQAVTKDLHEWAWFKPRLVALSLFLHRRDSRQRLTERCCDTAAKKKLLFLFDKAVCPKLIEHRWEVVTKCSRGCLSRRNALRLIWDEKKYGQSGGGDSRPPERPPEGDGESVDIGLVTDAIRSLKFWGCCANVAHLASVFEELTHWTEGCDCHDFPPPLQYGSGHRLDPNCSEHLSDISQRPCPVAGLRASAMAAGDMMRIAKRMAEEAGMLLFGDLADLGEDDRSAIFHSFESGAAKLVQKLEVKFDFWKKIPHHLCILASHDDGTVASGAAECLRQYNAVSVDTVHHRLSVLLLSPAHVYSGFLDLLASRQRTLADMPEFQKIVARFDLISVNDRQGERPHAQIHRLINRATDSKAHTIDVEFRSAEIQAALHDAETVVALARYLDQLRNPAAVLREHNFLMHPSAVECNGSISQRVAWPLVYRCDPRNQYEPMAGIKSRQKRRKVQERKEDKQVGLLHAPTASLAADPISYAYQQHALAQWRKRDAWTTDAIYSLPGPRSSVWQEHGGDFLLELSLAMTKSGLSKLAGGDDVADVAALMADGDDDVADQPQERVRVGLDMRAWVM
jgi:hypothetical protein